MIDDGAPGSMMAVSTEPDFSPEMLKAFLATRVEMMVRVSFPAVTTSARKGAWEELRQRSTLDRGDFHLARIGKLTAGIPRAKIWAALWVDPSIYSLRLLDDGTQERVNAP
jgi:hypothetical protein